MRPRSTVFVVVRALIVLALGLVGFVFGWAVVFSTIFGSGMSDVPQIQAGMISKILIGGAILLAVPATLIGISLVSLIRVLFRLLSRRTRSVNTQ